MISKAEKVSDEDKASFNLKSAWVIDGALRLHTNIITNTTDATWFSECWNKYLIKKLNIFSKKVLTLSHFY